MSSVPPAWIRFLRVHAELTERMDRRLRERHGLSLREYEVLLALDDAPGRRLRRVDLAGRTLLTQGGVTRLLDKLEREGLTAKVPDDADRRVVHAELTDAGRQRLRAAARTHHADIARDFTAHLSDRDRATLDRLLRRLPGGAGEGAWREPGR